MLILLIALSLPSAAPAAPPSPASDALALLSLKSSVDPSHHLSFNRSLSPCRWPGVRCSPRGRVFGLIAGSSSLNGTLPSSALSSLDQLRVLSLRSNALFGPVPDLSPLINLKALFLSRNLFSGPFPASLLSLRRLRTLDLSHNLLSGPIPPSIADVLDHLYCLRLDSNRLDGPLPPLNQSTLKIFNASRNNLTGPVPVTAALSAFDASVFSANHGLCGEAVRRECRDHLIFFRGPSSVAPPPVAAADGEEGSQLQGLLLPPVSKKTHKRAVAAVWFLGAASLAIVFTGVSLGMRRKRRTRRLKALAEEKDTDMYEENNGNEVEASNSELVAAVAMSEERVKGIGKSGCLMFCAGEAPLYTLELLMRASAEILGKGSVGTTYKAVMDNRMTVCVKRLDASKLGAAGKEVFERHMDAVGRLRHPNLVPLRAYFQQEEERLLVYDYQSNGSLCSLIHGTRSTRAKPLHWTSCLKIAEDIAQGLAYIHQASRLVHGNVKSSNILLGSDFEARLTDNCLSSLLEPSDGEDDLGYIAPETCKSNRPVTHKSDIYAFGVLLLELLTGKPPSQHPVLIATDLPVWVRSAREDERIKDQRLAMIINIAAACVRSAPDSRPTTWQILKMIQEVKQADTMDNDDDSARIS